jgi:sugar lactone lactonase YvrE
MRSLGSLGFLLLVAGPVLAQDMPLSQILLPDEGWRPVKLDARSVAGLAGDGRGDLFVSDPEGKRILRLGKDGKSGLYVATSKVVRGLAVGGGEQLYACQPEARRLIRVSSEGKEEVIAEGHAFQEVAVTRAGACYATVPDERAVYLITVEGKMTVVDKDGGTPAGVVLWNDQGTLVVSDAVAPLLLTFRIEKDGSLSAREGYYTLRAHPKQASGGAGMTLDAAGRLFAGSRAGVQVFDPTGRLSGVLLKPATAPAGAVALAGTDQDLLYAVFGENLYVRKLRPTGKRGPTPGTSR